VLDMRALTFMDSTGLRLVIRWDTAAREEGFEFAIVPGTEVVQRVFRLTGMDEHLRIAEPPPEA
jgi:anti-sigma B factor antagonist